MKYFTFVDKDHFPYSKKEIWDTVLNIQLWPRLWKNVINIDADKDIAAGSEIHCYFTLFYLMHLHFYVTITTLTQEEFASFHIEGDFSGQGRWILRSDNDLVESTLYLHLKTHHFFLKLLSRLPFGQSLVQYSHRHVMLEGKKMIFTKLSHV